MQKADRIVAVARPGELRPEADGTIDVFAALERQFFWADTVIVSSDAADHEADDEVLEGEIVL